MSQTVISADTYAAQFDALCQQGAIPAPIRALCASAFSCFETLGFPTTRLEQWRFTNVAPIADTPFRISPDSGAVDPAALHRVPRLGGAELVFVNGVFAPALSRLDKVPARVRLRSLARVLKDDPDVVAPYLARLAPFEHHAFTALNTAFLRDGAVVEVEAGAVVDTPLHLLFLSSSESGPVLSQPRVLLVAGENSQIRVVESHTGVAETPYLSNSVTEVHAPDSAVVEYYTLVDDAESAFHIGGLHATLGRATNFSSHTITLSGSIVRNEASVVLGGEGGECTLNGLYFGNGHQLVDNQTTIDHATPHCDSHELYKGILDGHSRAVFNGKIIVRLDAQKTDAKQSNKALLLSEDAQVTTKPQLEIFADDVKCTHGATVGQLDEESLFYLRSRALSETQARQLLIHAFAADLLGHIKLEAIRRQLDTLLLERLPLRLDE